MSPRSSALLLFKAIVLSAVVGGCGSSAATGGASATATATATASATPSGAEPSAVPSGAMKVRFLNLTDGAPAAAALDKTGHPLLPVRVEVSGAVALEVSLASNGILAVDAGGRGLSAENKDRADPFVAEIPWLPAAGAGEYTLTVTAVDEMKNFAEATVHVTVTGVPVITPLPPAMTEAQARTRVKELIQQKAHVTIPSASLQRFDFPQNPTRSRWIGAAYYKGTRYYVQIFDDLHVEWSNGPYADTAHRSPDVYLCRPLGNFKVLVVFVDYGNTGIVKADALAAVPPVVAWLNGMYTSFATSHGFSAPPMTVAADAAWVASPPVAKALLTAAQIQSLTGKNTAAYDFTIQIDLDVAGGWGVHESPEVMGPGGGFALNGCGTGPKVSAINIWSSIPSTGDLQGGLVMDFDHELSHLFGMLDDWPYTLGVAGPGGTTIDDWIPYVMFGWTDADGDGVREIEDSTPYGTSGPKP
jgi:hypothetical protein